MSGKSGENPAQFRYRVLGSVDTDATGFKIGKAYSYKDPEVGIPVYMRFYENRVYYFGVTLCGYCKALF